MKQAVAAALAAMVLPLAAHADVASEIRIGQDGVFSAKNLLVMQKAGSTLFTRGVWGTTFLRVGILTSESTSITKNHGERIDQGAIKEGDLINVEGSLVMNSDSFMINASTLTDVALNTELRSLSGTLAGVDTTNPSFVLKNATFGSTRVFVGGATITKGARSITIGDLAKGDVILVASGAYDFTSGSLTASSVSVFQPKEKFLSKNTQGAVKSIDASAQRLVITVNGSDMVVHFGTSTTLLTKSRAKLMLGRIVVGDTVRVFGSIGDQHPGEVKAEVIRDMSF